MNVKKLKEVAEYILREPEGFDQDTFGNKTTNVRCGTECCIAGTAVLLDNPRKFLRGIDEYGPKIPVAAMARHVLGLTVAQGDKLFCASDEWPAQFATRYENTEPNTKRRARVAYDRIMHFIKTKGRE